MLPLKARAQSVLHLYTRFARITLDCVGQVIEQLRAGNGSITAKSRFAFKPQDGDLA